MWVDGVAQLIERRTWDQKERISNPIRSIRHIYEFVLVKNVVMTRCRCPQPPCVYMTLTRMITYGWYRSCSPCQSSVDNGNMKRHSMHWNAIAELVLRTTCLQVCEWMRAIHVRVCVAIVRGALSHADHGNCAYISSSFIHSYVSLFVFPLYSLAIHVTGSIVPACVCLSVCLFVCLFVALFFLFAHFLPLSSGLQSLHVFVCLFSGLFVCLLPCSSSFVCCPVLPLRSLPALVIRSTVPTCVCLFV